MSVATRTGWAFGALVAIIAVARPAPGDEVAWDCSDGGVFNDTACWLGDVVPGLPDTALFDADGLYTVTFPASPASIDRLVVRSGLVTFDMTASGSNLQLRNISTAEPSLVVGETGPANVILAAIVGPGSLIPKNVVIGQHPGSLGMLEVILSPDALFEGIGANGMIEVGAGGIGILSLDAGDELLFVTGTHDWVIGRDAGSAGFASLIGRTSDNSGAVVVGKGGLGDLRLEGGADIVARDAVLGEQPGSYGVVTITGAGSGLDLFDGGLIVGLLGHGELAVESGGLLAASDSLVLGAAQGGLGPGVGEVSITGTGSVGVVGGQLFLGVGGAGTLVLSSGGTLGIDGDVLRGDAAANEVLLELAGADDYPAPALDVGGMTDALDVRVRLVGGFTPSAGDTFAVAAAGLSLDPVTFVELPTLPGPLEWVTVQDGATVALLVGPVPGDADGDGDVDVDDLVIVIAGWGPCPDPPAPCPGDVDGDGEVDVDDLVSVVENWG